MRLVRGWRASAGLTLIEVMVVVVILGLLAGLVGVNVFGQLEKAKVRTATNQIANLSQSLATYKLDAGRYPTTEQGLESLIQKPAVGNVPRNYPVGGYLEKKSLPEDPWGSQYMYLSPGINNPASFDLWTRGPDGEDGTGDDVNNWGGNAEQDF